MLLKIDCRLEMCDMNKEKMQDVKEMRLWLEREIVSIGKDVQATSKKPTLYSVIAHDKDALDEETKNKYKKYLSTPNAYAVTFGTLAIAGSAGAVGTAGATALGVAGVTGLTGISLLGGVSTASLSLLGPIGWSVLGGLVITTFVTKKIKSKDKSEQVERDNLEQLYLKCQTEKKNIQQQLLENEKSLKELFQEYYPKALEKLKNTSKKVAITIDDIMNMDQNKRIMQYQKIALNQYQSQNELRELLQKMTEVYNTLLNENQKLLLELEQYHKNEMLCCETNNFIE